VFLSTDTKSGARMIRQLREMGVEVPIMGGNSLNLGPLKELVGEAGDNTIVPAFYSPREGNARQDDFIRAYKSAYQKIPDQNAAQGYDSLMLLATAIERGKSTHPKSIASTLHHLAYWVGVTGVHAFDDKGDVAGKKYFFQILRNGHWIGLPAVHFPYTIWQFDRINTQAAPANNQTSEMRGYVRQFINVRSESDLHILQLHLVYDIFKFKRLGVIYAEDGDPKKTGKLISIRKFADRTGFALETCGVKQLAVTVSDMEKQLTRCLGKLSTQTDVINITGIERLDADTLRRLQAPLDGYRIPLISLQGDTNLGQQATVRLGVLRSINNTNSQAFFSLFGSIVSNQSVHEFADKVENLPVLEVNMQKLDEYNLLRSSPLVYLSPDFLIEVPNRKFMQHR